MKKFYILLAFVAISMLSMAQVNQLVWANGRLLYGSPIKNIDSLTYGNLGDIDTLHLLLPKTTLNVIHDTVIIHDTIYVNNGSEGGNEEEGKDDNNENETITSEPNYFYIASLEDNNSINLTNPNTWLGVKCTQMEYSLDHQTWSRLKGSDVITLNTADTLFIRCRSGNICKTNGERKTMFTASKMFNIGGDINTLMFDYKTKVDSLPTDYCMLYLFESQRVVDASQLVLPATKLSKYCYSGMFYYCTSLTKAPELPATSLAESCYASMFYHCNLKSGPSVLPADSLANGSYSFMFYNCGQLNEIKCLATDISAENCTREWITGVSNRGKFIQSADATCWSIGKNGIPSGWTIEVEYND